MFYSVKTYMRTDMKHKNVFRDLFKVPDSTVKVQNAF